MNPNGVSIGTRVATSTNTSTRQDGGERMERRAAGRAATDEPDAGQERERRAAVEARVRGAAMRSAFETQCFGQAILLLD